MKQKELTKKQIEVLKKLENAMLDCWYEDIYFFYDISDGSISAFNSQNVDDAYSANDFGRESPSDEEIDFDKVQVVCGTSIDWIDSGYNTLMLKFER
jgi:hypothetical protein